MAMLPAERAVPPIPQYLNDKDETLRGAAAEGYARLRIRPIRHAAEAWLAKASRSLGCRWHLRW